MTGYNYYVLTSLPTLGEFGSSAPLKAGELLETVSDNASSTALLEAVYLSDDLLQYEAFLAGEITAPNPVVLTEAQASQKEPLPGYLAAGEQAESLRVPGDQVWSNYFHHAAAVADRLNCCFLKLWVEYEVTLRNAIAASRAKALNLEPNDYLVATELAGSEEDFTALLNEWSRSENPLAGLRILDKARWDWLIQHDGWFTFDNDELAAYGAKLILLHRWQRLGQAEPEPVASASANTRKKPERTSV